MAAPPNKTLRDLNGTWVMNKTLSDSPEPGLALQGIAWITRKGIGLATVTLDVKEYEDPESKLTKIEISQTASGLQGTKESRTLDNEYREHGDWLFGKVKARSQWITSAADLPDDDYLKQGWEDGTTEWIYGFVQSLDSTWTATQLWGFSVVKGDRRHTRNVVISKGDKKVQIRLVYDYIPQ